MLSTAQIGTISELQAIINAIKSNYIVCMPVTVESFDCLISPDKGKTWLRAQTKKLQYREDKKSFVLFATKGNNQRYEPDEVDVFLAVLGDEVFIVNHNGQREHWSVNPETKWKKIL